MTGMKVEYELTDGGSTKKLTNATGLLKQNLEDVKTVAARTSAAVKAAMAPTSGSKTAAAIQGASQSSSDLLEYNQAKGIAGATGAAGRDFAKQAQGLGGLVHVYATFAANLFAVSAAFRALSDAADTTNMIKGLDQLSAVSGQSLGSLAKQISATTDGAISMRDAMEAATKGSAAGLNSEQMLKMSEVAKKASQALGISMPDAISRLSRGISKLEPELLDELGIYTRLQKSNEDYARTIGKTVSSLTDFEKRQAFANAVLKEGLDKFSTIELQANPYDKVLASIKDLAQSGLELVNKVLGPIVKFLAESPTGLSLALAAVGTVLLKQAIPALGSFKESLKDSADKATALANLRSLEAKKAAISEFATRKQLADNAAEDELHAFENAASKLEAIRSASNSKIKKSSKEVYDIISKASIQDITDEDLKRIDEFAAKKTRIAPIYKELADGVRGYRKAEEDYNLEVAKGLANLEKQEKWYTTLSQLKAAAERDNQRAATREITSSAAQLASIQGISAGWKELNAQIAVMRKGPTTKQLDTGIAVLDESGKKQFDEYGKLVTKMEEVTVGKMGAIRAGWTRLTGTLGILTGAVGTALNAFGVWGQVIGIAVAAFQLLDSWISSSAKEMAAFETAVETSTAAVDNAARTLETFYKKTDVSLSIQGVSALANAFSEVESSAKKAFEAADKVKLAMNFWDKLGDSIMSIFGSGVDAKLAKNIGKEFTSAMGLLKAAKLDDKYTETFKALLNVDNLNKDISEAFAKLTEGQKKSFIDELSKAATELNKSKTILEGFKSTTEASTKAYQDFVLSTANNDPLFKLSGALEAQATAALKTTENLVDLDAAFLDLAKSPEKAVLFGEKFLANLTSIRNEYLDVVQGIDTYTKAIENNKKAQDKAATDTGQKKTTANMPAGSVDLIGANTESAIKRLKAEADVLVKARADLETANLPVIERGRAIYKEGISEAFIKASEYLATALDNAATRAGLTIAKAKAGALTGEVLAKEQTRITKAELALQLDSINTSTELITAQESLIAAIDRNTAAIGVDTAVRQGLGGKAISDAGEQFKAANIVQELKAAGKIITKEMIDAATTDESLRTAVSQRVSGFNRSIATQQAAKMGVQAQMTAADITGSMAAKAGSLQDAQKLVQLQTDLNAATTALYSTYQGISSVTSKEVVNAQNLLEIKNLEAKQSQEIKAIDIAIANAKAINTAAGEKEAQKQTQYKALVQQKQEVEKTNLSIQQRLKLISIEAVELQKAADLEKQRRDIVFAQQSATLEVDSARLSSASQLYGIEESIVRQRTYALDLQKAELDNTKAVADARAAYALESAKTAPKLTELDTAIQSGDKSPEQVQALLDIRKQLTDELAKQKSAMDTAVTLADTELNKRKDILGINKQAGDEQQRYNDLLKSSTNIAESLKGIFGDIGAAMGGLVTSITDFAVASEKSAKAQQGIVDRLNAAELAGGDLTQLTKEYNAQKLKGDKEEVAGYGKIAGAAKSLFKEKSAGYKLMANLEKVAHITTIGLEMKTLALKVSSWWTGVTEKVAATAAETGVTEAGFMARLPIYIKEIYASWGSMGPWMAAAAGLFIASKLGGGGGGSQVDMTGLTSADRQATQGTGQAWIADSTGKLVKTDTGGGVFGDSSAKSTMIVDSLEIMKNNSIEGLDYDNRMLKALEKLAESVTGAAKSLYSIPGLRQGTNFGTQAGSTSSGGFGSDIPIVGKLLGSIFGGGTSSSTSITSAGIQLKGSFTQVMNDTVGSIMQYKDVLTQFHEDGGWFGSDSDWSTLNRETDKLKAEVSTSISDIFKDANKLFVALGEKTGVSLQSIQSVLNNFDISMPIDIMNLKGQELIDELNGVIGAKLSEVGKTIFTGFDQYKNFGEDYLTTVIRVVDSNNKVDQALRSMGNTFDITAKGMGSAGFGISEALIKAAGSLENFMSQADYFTQNFLTDAERLAPIRASVSKEMTRLGISLNTTKADFKKLVLAQDLSTDAGREMYQSLMDLAPGFNTVIEGITSGLDLTKTKLQDTVSAFTDFAKNIKAFRDGMILSSASIATPAEKLAVAKTQFETTYAAALAGDKDAMGKLTGTATTLLDLGKTMYASSDEYSKLFNYVSDKLGAAEVSALASVDVAQLQLTAINAQVTLLTEINANIATIAGVPAKAGGGRVSGLTLVGEMGPELVDFSTPGRVYPADQTAGMFTAGRGNQAMGAVVVELQQLRQEVAQLRKDQQKQTGDIIISNYDANQKASEEIATAVAETSKDVMWSDRSKSEIK